MTIHTRTMKKNKEERWLHIGHFELGIEKSSKGNMLVCRSEAKNWSVRWRDDTLMFGMMLSLMENEAAHEYIHSLITMMFVATTYTHDLVSLCEKQEMPFMQGMSELLEKQNEFEASLKPQPTEEEEQKSIGEMRRIAEVADEMMASLKEKENGTDQVQQQ